MIVVENIEKLFLCNGLLPVCPYDLGNPFFCEDIKSTGIEEDEN